MGFTEIADRCFVARYPQWDVNVGLVAGATGTLVVDTRASLSQGREVLDDVLALDLVVPVTHVVNTHVHFDHTFGNAAFGGAQIIAHQRCAARASSDAARVIRALTAQAHACEDPAERDLLEQTTGTRMRAPDETFGTELRVDLGGREVRLRHAGRGHTDGDIVVRVPDAGVHFLGDLVEESGPPALGNDSFPLEWATTLTGLLPDIGSDDVVVPGHGAPVDREYVVRQRDELSQAAHSIRRLRAQGDSLETAIRRAERDWPWSTEHLVDAVTRGYAHLRSL